MDVQGRLEFDIKNMDIVLLIVNDRSEILNKRIIKWYEVKSETTYNLHLYGLTVSFTNITMYDSDHPLSCEIFYKADWIKL